MSRQGLAIFITALALGATLILWQRHASRGKDMGTSSRQEVEAILGVPLPSSASQLHAHTERPSTQLAFYMSYVKLHLDRPGFDELVQKMNLSQKGSPAALGLLPAAWGTEPGVKLPWWTPKQETPEDAAARSHSEGGWIAAKWEAGDAYVIVTETHPRR